MRHKIYRWLLLTTGCAFAWVTTSGQTADQIAAAKSIIERTAPADVAAKCASLVAGASEKERIAVAAAVGRVVASVHPKVVTQAMTAIAHRVPVAAAAAAAAAAAELPDYAGPIAGAAAAAPGVEAREVISAVTVAVPAKAQEITSAVASALLEATRR